MVRSRQPLVTGSADPVVAGPELSGKSLRMTALPPAPATISTTPRAVPTDSVTSPEIPVISTKYGSQSNSRAIDCGGSVGIPAFYIALLGPYSG